MKNYLVVLLMSLWCFKTLAQDPNWSFNVSDYQFSMTLIGSLNLNGTTLSSTNDKVAAFVNGEIRGVANVSYVNSLNKYVAFLSIYANTSGETVSFKIYDSSTETVIEPDKTIIFKIDDNLGSVFQSISLAKPALSNIASFTAFDFIDAQEESVIISDNTIAIKVAANTNITNLIASFSVNNNAKVFIDKIPQTSGVSSQNFTSPIIYQVLSEDESTLKEYLVTVTKEIIVSDLTVNLSSSANLLVAQNPIVINVKTSEAVLSLKEEDFALLNSVIQSVNKINETNYNVNLIAIKKGDFSIELQANTIETLNNKGNNASNKLLFSYDDTKPYLISILRKTPISEITNATSLEFTATFNKDVQNVDASSFKTVTDASIQVEKVSDKIYTIKISNIENFSGAISVSLRASNTITDNFGNALRTTILKNY
jgi:hypothetical protein